MKQIGLTAVTILFLPLVLLYEVVKSGRSIGRKVGYFLLAAVVFGVIWLNGINDLRDLITYNLFQTGVTDKITKVKVSGTSMLPTIKDKDEVTLNSPKKYGLKYGDIVSFNNKETGNLFYIKRIIGLPEEQLSIKNGFYYINGKALDEGYTLNHLPTFGNTFLSDCDSVTIPKDSYFVSGDNRTVSSDSRVIGFVNKDDIEGVIKTNIVEKFASDQKQASLTKVDIKPENFLKLLNEQRDKHQTSPLVTNETLNGLAKKRVDQIKENFNDWKKEQSASSDKTVSVEKLLDSSGYRYNLVHEYVTFGYLDEQGILDQIFDLSTEKDSFLSSKYTEVGIGVTERTFQECKYPIISIILSWPSVPTYDKSVVDSWVKEINITNQLISNMQTWVGIPGTDQDEVKKIINLVAQQNDIATRIYNKEKNREWLTQKDYQDIKYYDELVKQSNGLVQDFFGKTKNVQGVSTSNRKEDTRRF